MRHEALALNVTVLDFAGLYFLSHRGAQLAGKGEKQSCAGSPGQAAIGFAQLRHKPESLAGFL